MEDYDDKHIAVEFIFKRVFTVLNGVVMFKYTAEMEYIYLF